MVSDVGSHDVRNQLISSRQLRDTTKKLIDNEKVLLKIEKLQQSISEIEKELDLPLMKIKGIERTLQLKIGVVPQLP